MTPWPQRQVYVWRQFLPSPPGWRHQRPTGTPGTSFCSLQGRLTTVTVSCDTGTSLKSRWTRTLQWSWFYGPQVNTRPSRGYRRVKGRHYTRGVVLDWSPTSLPGDGRGHSRGVPPPCRSPSTRGSSSPGGTVVLGDLTSRVPRKTLTSQEKTFLY